MNAETAGTLHHIETMAYGRCIQRMRTIKEHAKLSALMLVIAGTAWIAAAFLDAGTTIGDLVYILTGAITMISGATTIALIFAHELEHDRALVHQRAASHYDPFNLI